MTTQSEILGLAQLFHHVVCRLRAAKRPAGRVGAICERHDRVEFRLGSGKIVDVLLLGDRHFNPLTLEIYGIKVPGDDFLKGGFLWADT